MQIYTYIYDTLHRLLSFSFPYDSRTSWVAKEIEQALLAGTRMTNHTGQALMHCSHLQQRHKIWKFIGVQPCAKTAEPRNNAASTVCVQS